MVLSDLESVAKWLAGKYPFLDAEDVYHDAVVLFLEGHRFGGRVSLYRYLWQELVRKATRRMELDLQHVLGMPCPAARSAMARWEHHAGN